MEMHRGQFISRGLLCCFSKLVTLAITLSLSQQAELVYFSSSTYSLRRTQKALGVSPLWCHTISFLSHGNALSQYVTCICVLSLINIQWLGSPHPPINKLGDAHYLVRPIIYMQPTLFMAFVDIHMLCFAYMLVLIVYILELPCSWFYHANTLVLNHCSLSSLLVLNIGFSFPPYHLVPIFILYTIDKLLSYVA